MDDRDIHEQLQGGQLETILATIPVGVFITDAEGKIVKINDRAREIWGGRAPEGGGIESYGQYRAWWPDTGEPLKAEDWAAARVLRNGEPILSETVDIERFDGKRATIVNSASALRDDRGRIVGAVAAIQDITERRERQRANELMLEALGALAGSLELSEVLHRLVSVLYEMVGHTRASAFLWHEQTAELELAASMGGPLTERGRLPLSWYSAEMQRAVRQRARAIVDFSTVPPDEAGMARVYDIATSLIVPLVRLDRALGVVTVDEMRPGVEFTDREVALAEGIASSAALAIENARLYEAEHHVAETLQRALLALPDHVDRITFAHAYRSASDEAFVGGDFYDLFEIERDLVGILIGDIAGKGLDAAVLTQLVRNTVRAHAAEKGNSPAAILSLTNTVFYQTTSSDSFATAFFGVLDRSTGALVYTNAGHTSTLLARADGAVVELSANSPLLGAFADRTFSQSEVRLGPHDALVLYTDGVTEARAGGKQFGEERLLQAVTQAAAREPSVLVQAIVDEVLAFAEGALNDDIAILVVRRAAERPKTPTGLEMQAAVP